MKSFKKYLAEIGAKGGKASRRKITPEQQAAMQEARKAKRLCKEQNVKLSERRRSVTLELLMTWPASVRWSVWLGHNANN